MKGFDRSASDEELARALKACREQIRKVRDVEAAIQAERARRGLIKMRVPALGGESGTSTLGFPHWGDWGRLMQAIALSDLPYLSDDTTVFDATVSLGVFWKHWQPNKLVTNDIDPDRVADHRWDWSADPCPSDLVARFDTAAFDPDFKLSGTNEIMLDRYGLDGNDTNMRRTVKLFVGALAVGETVRSGGWLLVKCQPSVASGRIHDQPRRVANLLEEHGWTKVGEFIRQYTPVPQPEKTRQDGKPVLQEHEARNYATLVVMEKK